MKAFTTLIRVSIVICIAVGVNVPAQTADIDPMIRKHRMGQVMIKAAPNTTVEIRQLRHEFWFGAAISSSAFGSRMSDEDKAQYKKVFLENFNAAVTENALKWHSMEYRKGRINYSTVDAMLAWTDENDIPLRGHNIFWGIPNRVQNWLKEMDDEQLHEAIQDRAVTIAKRYKGRFAEYDLNNEMIHGNYYADRLGDDITKKMADWIKQYDPDAKLFLNDYDILTGNRMDDYMKHIRQLKKDKVQIDGIGVQGHLHGDTFDSVKLRNALDELAKTNLPICITEFNFPGQRSSVYGNRDNKLTPVQEQAKAKAITDYYRICFANPAVEGILMWGFWEGANWIPQSSLYKRDWTPTTAAKAYRDLVYKKWWTNKKGKTDKNGIYKTQAFYGKHKVTVNGKEKTVDLKKTKGKETISFE